MPQDPLPVDPTLPAGSQGLRSACHPACFVCSPANAAGLHLDFHLAPDDTVEGHFTFAVDWEGYSGFVHGGIVAAALDGAMTNWLLAHGRAAVTAELKVRYRHPVATQMPVAIVARHVETSGPVFIMSAELRQGARLAATATAKFLANASSAQITKVHA